MKIIAKILLLCICSILLPLHAQQITSLTGQYGCLLNRNFGGYNLALIQGTNDGSITGSNFLIHFDFANSKWELNVVGLKTWGVEKVIPGSRAVTNGTLSVTKGPLTNTFFITATVTVPGQTYVTTFNIMPVNGGSTLLLQQGIAGNGDGEPTTGVCNKV